MGEASKAPMTPVGAGFIGTVIATLYARYGYRLLVADTAPRSLRLCGAGPNRLQDRWFRIRLTRTLFWMASKRNRTERIGRRFLLCP